MTRATDDDARAEARRFEREAGWRAEMPSVLIWQEPARGGPRDWVAELTSGGGQRVYLCTEATEREVARAAARRLRRVIEKLDARAAHLAALYREEA